MASMGMLPMIASLVGSDSAVIGLAWTAADQACHDGQPPFMINDAALMSFVGHMLMSFVGHMLYGITLGLAAAAILLRRR